MQQLFYVLLILVVILIAAVYYLYTQDIMSNTSIATLKTRLDVLTNNVDDIATVSQLSSNFSALSAKVQALQTNPINAVSSAISPSMNATVTTITSANAITLALNAKYALTHYAVTITPASTGGQAYIDIPLLTTINQGFVMSNRGIFNAVTTPSASSNIINDIRTIITPDGTTARVQFTPNGSTDHQLSLTVLSE